jgi:drug/metabolite transporter (DMT)-like permease
MLVFAVYAVYLRLRPQIHWLSFMFVFALVSCVTTLPFFVWETLSGITFKPTLLTFGAILYVSIFPSVLAFAAWNRGVELIGANRAGPFVHLVPIYTAILASTLLGEHLASYHIIGFVLILAGVWLASVRKPAVDTPALD